MKVCILNAADARLLIHGGIEFRCSSRRHHHSSKAKVDELVKAGQMIWLGKHRKAATMKNPRSWKKVYHRNGCGEVMSCSMQLVRE